MAKDKEEIEETKQDENEIGLVTLRQDSGIGIRLPEGNILDITDTPVGTAQVLAHIVKTLDEIKRNIG